MLELEVLVLKLGAIDGLAASAIASSKVTTLNHELLDHTVEDAALVVQWLAGLANALLARAQGAEVLCGLGHNIIVELEDDAAYRLATNRDVEEAPATVLLLLGAHGLVLLSGHVGRTGYYDEGMCGLRG